MATRNRSLPPDFTNRLETFFGAQFAATVAGSAVERPTTFRVNTLKADRRRVRQGLFDLGFKLQSVAWYGDAFILKNKSKRELSETDFYATGQIYLQSLASMAPPLALNPAPGEIVLDLTAAPGSKTTQVAALMKGKGELVANDSNQVRFAKLSHNAELLGCLAERPGWQCRLYQEPGAKLVQKFPNYFDKILIDAPCSAEARFIAGDRATYGYWSERNIREMAYKQRQLLLSAWGALKPGGTLVYSTCTFAPEENELQVVRLLERFKDAMLRPAALAGVRRGVVLKSWNNRPLPGALQRTLRLLPTREIEGFFIAKVEKKVIQ